MLLKISSRLILQSFNGQSHEIYYFKVVKTVLISENHSENNCHRMTIILFYFKEENFS